MTAEAAPSLSKRDGMDKAIAASGRFYVVVRQAQHDMKKRLSVTSCRWPAVKQPVL